VLGIAVALHSRERPLSPCLTERSTPSRGKSQQTDDEVPDGSSEPRAGLQNSKHWADVSESIKPFDDKSIVEGRSYHRGIHPGQR
jgi:hypothetical protein